MKYLSRFCINLFQLYSKATESIIKCFQQSGFAIGLQEGFDPSHNFIEMLASNRHHHPIWICHNLSERFQKLCRISKFEPPVQVHEIETENFWCLRMASLLLNCQPFQIHHQIFGITEWQFCSQIKRTFCWNLKTKHYNFQLFDAFETQYSLQDLKNTFFEIPIE